MSGALGEGVAVLLDLPVVRGGAEPGDAAARGLLQDEVADVGVDVLAGCPDVGEGVEREGGERGDGAVGGGFVVVLARGRWGGG